MTTPSELDVEDFVIAYLASQNVVPSGQVAARMPAQLPVPFVLVRRVAGGDDYIVDKATIQIDSFNADQTSASDTARAVHHAMRQLHAKTVVNVEGFGNANVYTYQTEQTPLFMEYQPGGGAAAVERYVARYVIWVRLPSITGY